MKTVLVAILAAAALAACARVERSPAADGAAGGSLGPAPAVSPVVLELFTSQGCSSCPPADAALSRLGEDPALAGRVVPLAFHVDYWDYIGWRDPFASADWTARQYAYAKPFGMDGVYTPQLVVNGREHLNGAEEARVRELVAELGREPGAAVEVTVAPASGGKLAAEVRARVPEALETSPLDAVVVLFENGVATKVARGENRGRTLENDYVVRRLSTAFRVGAEKGASGSGSVVFDLDPGWRAENLGVAAFLQDARSMRIYGAAVARAPEQHSGR